MSQVNITDQDLIREKDKSDISYGLLIYNKFKEKYPNLTEIVIPLRLIANHSVCDASFWRYPNIVICPFLGCELSVTENNIIYRYEDSKYNPMLLWYEFHEKIGD